MGICIGPAVWSFLFRKTFAGSLGSGDRSNEVAVSAAPLFSDSPEPPFAAATSAVDLPALIRLALPQFQKGPLSTWCPLCCSKATQAECGFAAAWQGLALVKRAITSPWAWWHSCADWEPLIKCYTKSASWCLRAQNSSSGLPFNDGPRPQSPNRRLSGRARKGAVDRSRASDGIFLPDLLTADAVMDALDRAGPREVSRTG